MKLSFKHNKAPKLPKKVTRAEYEDLIEFLNVVLITKHNNLSEDFEELRDELATNGVVRDLRKAEKEIEKLHGVIEDVNKFVVDRLNELNTNGVATAIDKLNEEVFSNNKAHRGEGWDTRSLVSMLTGGPTPQYPTLAGKVDAIIAHLGIDVSVKPKEVTPAQVVTTKVKAPAKKKGRK